MPQESSHNGPRHYCQYNYNYHTIRNVFIPALIGRPVNDLERRLLALPVRLGGLGLQDPSSVSHIEYLSSVKITEALTSLIYNQNMSLSDLDYDKFRNAKLTVRSEKDDRFRKELKEICQQVDPLTKRSIEAAGEKGASSWLSALPLKHLGYTLNKQEFRDALNLRYNWHINDIPKYCGCGQRNDIVHVLSCKKGGYVSMRHNALRDSIANMLRESGCHDVRTEPLLLPVDPNNFSSQTNVADGARLDISARGVHSAFECTFFDVRVSHPYCASNVVLSLPSLYVKNEKEKIVKYDERVRECEKGSFVPLVFLTTGGMGPACTKIIKRIADLIANRKNEQYSQVINFVRTRLRFSLLKSVLIAIRGVRGKMKNESPVSNISFNLIPAKNFYEI